jgi:DNA-binding NarL/FixJ family response regulator
MLHAKELTDKELRKTVINFGIIFLTVYTLDFLIAFRILLAQVVYYLYPLMDFSVNLPALVYLKYALDNYYKEHPLMPENEVDLDRFFSQHNISNREQEIIHLILKGKSNRDIEDELYISLRTVKNHIYNIYKKLGVKSRWQLINMIRNLRGIA